MVLIIITIIICAIICSIAAFTLFKIKKETNLQKKEKEELVKEQKTLTDNIEQKIKTIQDLRQVEQNTLLTVNKYTEKQNNLVKDNERIKDSIAASYDSYCQHLDEQYNKVEKEFDNKILNLQNTYSLKQEEINQILKDLQEIKNKRKQTIEVLNKEQAELEDEDTHCLKITAADISDINTLERIKPQLTKPRVLSMLIWSTWFQKPMTELCNKLIGTTEKCGIYKITNMITKECYIGQSLKLSTRLKQHAKCGLGIDTPPGNKLYKAMIEDGIWNFSWSILEYCTPEQLNERESFYIDLFNSYNYGYNSNAGIKSI